MLGIYLALLLLALGNHTAVPALMTHLNGSTIVFNNITAARNYLLHKDIQQQQQFQNNGSDPNFYCKSHGTVSNGLIYCPPLQSSLLPPNKTGMTQP